MSPLLESPLVHGLPAPREVRDRLADVLREAELLRALLRLSERAARYRERDQELIEERRGKRA
jgi:hypothetical protein